MAAMKTVAGIEYRLLYGSALEILRPTIEARGWIPLNPETACAFVAFEGENVVGFVAQNPIPHVEPLWVSPEYRGTGMAEELVGEMVKFLYNCEAPAAFIIADNPASEKLAIAYGMKKVTSPVYYKKG